MRYDIDTHIYTPQSSHMSSVYPLLLGSLITIAGLLQDSWLVIMFSIVMSKSCDDGNDPLVVIFEHVLLQL